MSGPVELDSAWIAANPIPVHGGGTDKNSRGRVLAVGGSARSPGAIRLTGEAALRVGAGKVQMATLGSAAMLLGLLVPEAGVIALPEQDGEIAVAPGGPLDALLGQADAVVVGPGMAAKEAAADAARRVAEGAGDTAMLVLDAAAIGCAAGLADALAGWRGRLVMTPHFGEAASLTGMDVEEIEGDPARVARSIADRFGAVVALKSSDTLIAVPDGKLLRYAGGGVGLATGGSGDVLAGAVAGLLARGADPAIATGWGVWLHGHSGRRMAAGRGPIGFLARELLEEMPRLLPQ